MKVELWFESDLVVKDDDELSRQPRFDRLLAFAAFTLAHSELDDELLGFLRVVVAPNT